ncbi:MAG: AMP-binding protein, partial [Gammaproteobacteria bacterium]|nr:AMP-binding protein [Gammaproteobacteria bacterium]
MNIKTYPVKASVEAKAYLNESQYFELYKKSIEDNEGFWAEQGKRIDWIKPFTKVKDVSYAKDDLHIKWYYDGSLNVCANCVDRHLKDKADQTAIIWEGDDPSISKKVTYAELHKEVSRFANVLKKLGVVKGDRVTLYMPMILEAAYAMLACARIGAVHSVVFGGFSADALAGRIIDCKSKLVITADFSNRGGKQ